MRLTFLALCLVGTLFANPAAADLISIEITSEHTSRPLDCNGGGAALTMSGDQFSLMAVLFSQGGGFSPRCPYPAGATLQVIARWSGIDAPGSFIYQGQTGTFGGINGPALFVQFVSDPFVVPPVDGSPIVSLPFTLTASIGAAPGQPGPFDLHGVGNMVFTFVTPIHGSPGFPDLWNQGSADFVIATPEPSAILLVATALGGLGVCAWRCLRFRRSSAAGT